MRKNLVILALGSSGGDLTGENMNAGVADVRASDAPLVVKTFQKKLSFFVGSSPILHIVQRRNVKNATVAYCRLMLTLTVLELEPQDVATKL